MKNITNINGKSYLISTVNTFDRGLETMVFKSDILQEETDDENKINYDVIDWRDLYANYYNTWEDAKIGHKDTIKNLDLILGGI